jgi:hypothetical protein
LYLSSMSGQATTLVDDINVDKKMLSEVMGKWSYALRIPVIQRDFEWDAEDVKELLDSIVRGYPIGSVILWETKVDFPSTPLIDLKEKYFPPTPLYVLDGQQRLTSLLLVKEGWKITRNGKELKIDPISYNPANNSFYISGKRGIDVSLIVRAALGDVTAFKTLVSDHPSDYKKAVENVGQRILQYQLPIYTIRTLKDISNSPNVANEIAEIFTRVNSAGVSLGNIQMFLSFFAAVFSELKFEIVQRYQTLFNKYDEQFPSWEVVNRFVFSNLGMTQNQITKIDSFKKAIESLKEQYSSKPSQLKEIISSSFNSMDLILNFISNETGIYHSNRIPSQNALLPLFKYVYVNKITNLNQISTRNKKLMLKWFIIASFNGYYTASPNKKIEQDLKSFKGESFPYESLVKNMQKEKIHPRILKKDIVELVVDVTRGNTGRSYLMLLNILLFRNRSNNWAGQRVTSKNSVVHHIFPREYLLENNIRDREDINDFANITLIDQIINQEIKNRPPSEYLKSFNKDALESHFIPLNEDLWKVENYEKFRIERSKLIWKGLEQLINKDLGS